MEELDYKNIKCDSTHKYCSVPKKISTKLKMFSTVAALTVVAVITFSGCETVKEDIIILTPTQQTTTCATTIEDTTNNKYIEEDITNPTKATQITTEKVSVIMTKPQTTVGETKKTITEKVEIETTKKEITTQKEIETTQKQENIDNEYNQLFQQLNQELEKKSFSDEVNKLFIDTFERLYENYSTWENGYTDLPSREQYIRNNVINIIPKISEVYYYDRDSKEAQEMLDDGSALAWTQVDEDNRPCIGIIAKNIENIDKEERNYDIENFLHEIRHCKQMSIMLDNSYFEGNKDIEQIIIEGGATFHMKFTNPLTTNVGGMWSILNEKGDRIIDYTKDNGLGYLVELNAYEKLVYLAGYTVMDKIESGEAPLSDIQKAISSKYGEQQANEMLQAITKWYKLYNEIWKSDEIYNLSIEVEQLFLEFIKQDIDSLTTIQEFERYIKKYEHYKTRNLPQVTDEQYVNHAYEVFRIKEIDDLINEKQQEFGIKPIKKEINYDEER